MGNVRHVSRHGITENKSYRANCLPIFAVYSVFASKTRANIANSLELVFTKCKIKKIIITNQVLNVQKY